MFFNWMWLLTGIIPCWAKCHYKKDEFFIQLHALFWQLTLHQSATSWSLELACTFIEWFKR